jgi:hypothetical protein
MKIASYHAKALDKIGSSYFIEENWWFYYGKVRPTDINGSVGIYLSKQALEVMLKSANGIITFRLRLAPIHY